MFLLYVDANSLVNSKGPTNTASSATVATSGGGVAMEFTVKELYAIEEIHSETHLLRLITGSVHLFSFFFILLFSYLVPYDRFSWLLSAYERVLKYLVVAVVE